MRFETHTFTANDSLWLDLACASSSLLSGLKVEPYEVVRLSHQDSSSKDDTTASTSCLLQLIPSHSNNVNDSAVVDIHPVVLDCLLQSVEALRGDATANRYESKNYGSPLPVIPVSLEPLDLPPFNHTLEQTADQSETCWVLSKVDQTQLPDGGHVQVDVVYLDPVVLALEHDNLTRELTQALEGRWIMNQTLHVLSIRGHCSIIAVIDVSHSSIEELSIQKQRGAFLAKTFSLHIRNQYLESSGLADTGLNGGPSVPCPGYDHVVSQVLDLLRLPCPAAPTGILLEGCSGVGKTRIASSIAREISTTGTDWVVHFVSLHDLLQKAAWANEGELLPDLLSPINDPLPKLVVVDDLDLLFASASSVSNLDAERRLVRNTLLQAIDKAVAAGDMVLGMTINASLLPIELVKTSRFEKVINVDPPTQIQREHILLFTLKILGVEHEDATAWSSLVARMTGGCVAADLNRLCLDAWTRSVARANDDSEPPHWDDIRDAARACVPSQLASLDVTKPKLVETVSEGGGWLEVHQQSWASFAGYESLVKRIYRTIVVPWRIYLRDRESTSVGLRRESPPSGVLFHGPSGSGKTLASGCLGSSLGLPMIKVRASDVLDKYLGGSEAIIRSIFSRARAASPCILLLDEVDSIASNRSTEGESTTGVMPRILSTLLNELDGVTTGLRDPVLVVACTNRLDTLDAALLRPGRLEEHVEIGLPSSQEALAILRLYLQKVVKDKKVNLGDVAGKLSGRDASAATIEGVAREAVLQALRRLRHASQAMSVTEADFDNALRSLNLK